MASYTKLAKNNWQVVISLGYDINGKKKRIKKQGFRLKSDAEKFVTEFLKKRNDGYILGADNKILFKDFIMEWYLNYKEPNISIHTRACYIMNLNKHILPYLGKYKLNEIDNLLIQKFYNNLIKNKKLKANSAQKSIDILIGCFKYAKKIKLISELPTDIVKAKNIKPAIKCWTLEQSKFFMNSISGTSLYKPIFIDLATGLRIAELCGLRWCDIDLSKGTLTVNNQVIYDEITKQLHLSSVLKTSTSNRVITLPDYLVNYLKELKNEENPTGKDFLITNRFGLMENPHCLSMRFTRAVRKFKKSFEEKKEEDPSITDTTYMQLPQISFHGLRHTHATILVAYGDKIKSVSERLGHKNITITLNTYTHVINDMKTNTAKLLEDVFNS